MLAIQTKFIDASNFKPARMQAKCDLKTIYVPYDFAVDNKENHQAACLALCDAMGWKPGPSGNYDGPLVGGYFGNACFWVWSTTRITTKGEKK